MRHSSEVLRSRFVFASSDNFLISEIIVCLFICSVSVYCLMKTPLYSVIAFAIFGCLDMKRVVSDFLDFSFLL